MRRKSIAEKGKGCDENLNLNLNRWNQRGYPNCHRCHCYYCCCCFRCLGITEEGPKGERYEKGIVVWDERGRRRRNVAAAVEDGGEVKER